MRFFNGAVAVVRFIWDILSKTWAEMKIPLLVAMAFSMGVLFAFLIIIIGILCIVEQNQAPIKLDLRPARGPYDFFNGFAF